MNDKNNMLWNLNGIDRALVNGDKFTVRTVGEAQDVARQFWDITYDEREPGGQATVHQDGMMSIHSSGLFDTSQTVYPSYNSIRHLVEFFNAPGLSAKYLFESCPTELAATNLNYWLAQRTQPLTWRLVRSADDTYAYLRAVRGPRYNTQLDNRPLLNALTMVERGDGTPVISREVQLGRSWVGQDGMRVQMKLGQGVTLPDLPNGGESAYHVGLQLTNNECGYGSFRVSAILWRTACDNSIVVPDWANVRIMHSKDTNSALAVAEVFSSLSSILTPDGDYNFHRLFDKVATEATDEMRSSGVLDTIGMFVDACGISEEKGTELTFLAGQYAPSRLGIANAVTELAQGYQDDAMVLALEQAAGKYLFTGRVGKVEVGVAED